MSKNDKNTIDCAVKVDCLVLSVHLRFFHFTFVFKLHGPDKRCRDKILLEASLMKYLEMIAYSLHSTSLNKIPSLIQAHRCTAYNQIPRGCVDRRSSLFVAGIHG
jgi:hypothetical protein